MYSHTLTAAGATSIGIFIQRMKKKRKRKEDSVYYLQMEMNLMDHKEGQSMSQK